VTHPWTIPLERIILKPPFGVRFRDDVRGVTVADGLTVELYPVGQPRQRVAAVPNQSGVFSSHRISGIAEFEFETGGPTSRTFTFEVTDRLSRFVPFSFVQSVPVHDGLVSWNTENFIPLFSSTSRTVPAGIAVVRAELWNPIAKSAAAWAVLDVKLGTETLGRGIADRQGRVAVLFAYPEPPAAVVESPLSGASFEPQWTLEVGAFCAPETPIPERPDLKKTLDQVNRPPAQLWKDALRTDPLTQVTVRYGHESVLRTSSEGTSPHEETNSKLHLTVP
jgi:hypothetical protein